MCDTFFRLKNVGIPSSGFQGEGAKWDTFFRIFPVKGFQGFQYKAFPFLLSPLFPLTAAPNPFASLLLFPDPTFYLFPQSFILLQFQIDLLAISAASPIFFSLLFLSPPSTPMSFRRDAIDDAGNPRHPTSTAHTVTS